MPASGSPSAARICERLFSRRACNVPAGSEGAAVRLQRARSFPVNSDFIQDILNMTSSNRAGAFCTTWREAAGGSARFASEYGHPASARRGPFVRRIGKRKKRVPLRGETSSAQGSLKRRLPLRGLPVLLAVHRGPPWPFPRYRLWARDRRQSFAKDCSLQGHATCPRAAKGQGCESSELEASLSQGILSKTSPT